MDHVDNITQIDHDVRTDKHNRNLTKLTICFQEEPINQMTRKESQKLIPNASRVSRSKNMRV